MIGERADQSLGRVQRILPRGTALSRSRAAGPAFEPASCRIERLLDG